MSVQILKKRLWHRCFPVNFARFLRIPFFTEHLRWLLLSVQILYRKTVLLKYQTVFLDHADFLVNTKENRL